MPASTSTTMVPAATAARSLCSAWDVTLGRGDFCLVKVGHVTSYKWRDMGPLYIYILYIYIYTVYIIYIYI